LAKTAKVNPNQKIVSLRTELKERLDTVLDQANMARTKADMPRINRNHLIEFALSKVTKEDYINPNL
jgi:hypothetical protein